MGIWLSDFSQEFGWLLLMAPEGHSICSPIFWRARQSRSLGIVYKPLPSTASNQDGHLNIEPLLQNFSFGSTLKPNLMISWGNSSLPWLKKVCWIYVLFQSLCHRVFSTNLRCVLMRWCWPRYLSLGSLAVNLSPIRLRTQIPNGLINDLKTIQPKLIDEANYALIHVGYASTWYKWT